MRYRKSDTTVKRSLQSVSSTGALLLRVEFSGTDVRSEFKTFIKHSVNRRRDCRVKTSTVSRERWRSSSYCKV